MVALCAPGFATAKTDPHFLQVRGPTNNQRLAGYCAFDDLRTQDRRAAARRVLFQSMTAGMEHIFWRVWLRWNSRQAEGVNITCISPEELCVAPTKEENKFEKPSRLVVTRTL